MRKLRNAAAAGFTLIELIVVVTIVGIILSIAVPYYFEYVAASKRADATAILTEAAQFMERNFSESARYDKDANGNDVVLPPSLTTVPRASVTGSGYYAISFTAAPALSATQFGLQAVPITTMAGDACGTLTIDWRGKRTVSGSLPVAQCWR